MTDIVKMLRECSSDEAYLSRQAADEIARLRAENSSLSAWQCVYTDGKTGLVGDEHGNQYCAMAKMVEALRAEVVQASQQLGNILAIIHRDGGHHTADVGIEQSVKDAHIKWANLMTENEKLWAALNLYREAVRIDVTMEGPEFMGSNTSALKRAWNADRAALGEK